MSALEVERINKGNLGFCLNRCSSNMGVRAGYARIFICGHPAGTFCKKCAQQMEAAWNGAQVRLRIRVNPFEGVYEVVNPDVVESAMFGPLLKGSFRMEGSDDPLDEGVFRMDRLDLIEPYDEQLEMAA